jgi:Type II CAAX prenyl endopeptidase Rce1-like
VTIYERLRREASDGGAEVVAVSRWMTSVMLAVFVSTTNNALALSVSSVLFGMLHWHSMRYVVLATVTGFMFGSTYLS